jgi:hypothetical protein
MQPGSQNTPQTKFVVAGYFFIQASKPPDWMNAKVLPPFVLSASRCICEKIPDAWIFPRNTNLDPDEDEERSKYQNAFGLSKQEFEELQNQFDTLLTQEEFGYPNIFMSRALAEDFYARYFYKLPNVRLMSMGLPEKDLRNFIERYRPHRHIWQNGVPTKLRQYQFVEEDAKHLGFEVLGFEAADFHSLFCGSTTSDDEVLQNYGIKFNQYGLIDRFEDTIAIVQDIREETLEYVEEGFWAAWLMSEYPLHK